jgi:hypothetical protein
MAADPPVRCSGQLIVFGSGDAICERGVECDAFDYFVADFAATDDASA